LKVLQINIFGNLSTGRIAVDIYKTLRDNEIDGKIAFSRNSIAEGVPYIKFGTKMSVMIDGLMTRLTDSAGFNSAKPTYELIREIKEYDPDIVHLHNLHGYYINVELLFSYLKETNTPVVWTLHDCWAFTGHCCNFESIGCEKWKTGCGDCKLIKSYPASLLIDNSKNNYLKKKKIFTSLEKMVLVTPSYWLKKLVDESYLQRYPVEVVRNGVDLNTFKPVKSNWAEKHNLSDKKIVLGVAGTWSPTKGLSDLVRLSHILPDTYKVVIVGVNKRQIKELPTNIVAIERTYNSIELAQIYSAAHVFVNPSYEDNFPNVNIEALSCGTPVVTYRTGGGPEIITEEAGDIVPRGDVEALRDSILGLSATSEACSSISREFDRSKCYHKYIEIYKSMIK